MYVRVSKKIVIGLY